MTQIAKFLISYLKICSEIKAAMFIHSSHVCLHYSEVDLLKFLEFRLDLHCV